MHINLSKCALYWPSISRTRLADVGISPFIAVVDDGLPLLGGAVFVDLDFLQAVAQKRFTKATSHIARLSILQEPQLQLLLLRNCLSIPKVNDALSTLPWQEVRIFGHTYDEALAIALSHLLAVNRS